MRYSVEGRSFNDFTWAKIFADTLSQSCERNVVVTEKIDHLTPWHVVYTARPVA